MSTEVHVEMVQYPITAMVSRTPKNCHRLEEVMPTPKPIKRGRRSRQQPATAAWTRASEAKAPAAAPTASRRQLGASCANPAPLSAGAAQRQSPEDAGGGGGILGRVMDLHHSVPELLQFL